MKVLPKAKNKLVDEAFALYRQGLKLKDIAEKLDVPSGTIRRWKSTYKWGGERSEKITNVRNGKRGGQPNNKNAVGFGAPEKTQMQSSMDCFLNTYQKNLWTLLIH